jgi:hypothetical protein
VLSQLCKEKQVLAGARAKGSVLHSRGIIEAAQTQREIVSLVRIIGMS